MQILAPHRSFLPSAMGEISPVVYKTYNAPPLRYQGKKRAHRTLRAWMILFLTSIGIFIAGILLSIYYNTMFLFLFLPFGFAWRFRGRRGTSNRDSSRSGGGQPDDNQRPPSWTTSTIQFCPHCGRRLGSEDLFCPSCGRPIEGRISNSDLR